MTSSWCHVVGVALLALLSGCDVGDAASLPGGCKSIGANITCGSGGIGEGGQGGQEGGGGGGGYGGGNRTRPRDCADLVRVNDKDDQYVIHPTGGQPFGVLCKFDHGGWTILMTNVGRLEWKRDWAQYRNGFGRMELGKSFWLGLEKIRWITSQEDRRYILRIDVTDRDKEEFYADYSSFSISDEENGYYLVYGAYLGGTAGDGLRDYHRNQRFSAQDRDNDADLHRHCACDTGAGWWYNECSYSVLTKGNIYWNEISSVYKKVTMRILPV